MQQPIPSSPSQPFNIHGISLRGKYEENWGQLLGPMTNQWNNRADFRVDVYPRQECLSFNSDYMVWFKRKRKMFVDPKNANMAEEILIDRHEDEIVHAAHPHDITAIKTIDFLF